MTYQQHWNAKRQPASTPTLLSAGSQHFITKVLRCCAVLSYMQCEEVQFVDVREPGEYQVARLPHFKLMPLSQASSWAPTVAEDMDPQAETVVLCHHGMRSMNTAMVRCLAGAGRGAERPGLGVGGQFRVEPLQCFFDSNITCVFR
eukprot:GHUV01030437.1.p1 GENE.GHUV01030437.1~~GHUV01030437.1.p1  ORF type:complete len:146 (-),score=25.75 GHUV01030437.1:323-760(-)